ncbi:hypothetical protein EMIHUDRAFT_212187 [Emiliania huxleyi CCMP1516]|uniref:Thioesterase domain-containing protein n=2 Tax=Emiliania huxleyi TaxID=2903 RepID=A0A0D3ISB8_EMIH1|nr:hypothetical protein EMIHUDRAFT_212187 [Emiliania huxleyi CCMP1516]EOD14153.1 hypothetical protein EMIHUDRAFT_212187 [Emiliania huxleyi CCMP1516]|eukprot:XP_005766582.1 hypothetical protein EMIHUDRAFT_212187 [Emiliania huxleyi CCMP1516]
MACPMVDRGLRAVAETLWLATTRVGSFGTLLGLTLPLDGGGLRFRQLDKEQSVLSLPLPDWSVRADGTLCLATALALHDEISTYGGMAPWDARHRPGVSISLSGRLVGSALCDAGKALHFVTRPLKLGRTLGYLELEIWSGDGEPRDLLAVGRHCKALKFPGSSAALGSLLQLGGHPAVYPLVQPIAYNWLASRPIAPPPLQPTRRADLFPPLAALSASGGVSSLLPDAAFSCDYSTPLSPALANMIGSLHGGAACILGEQAASTALRDSLGLAEAPPARAFAVQLLSALPCDGREARIAAAVGSGGGATRLGAVAIGSEQGSRAVECMAWYDVGREREGDHRVTNK